jgi:hypothetical protein
MVYETEKKIRNEIIIKALKECTKNYKKELNHVRKLKYYNMFKIYKIN